MSIEAYFSAVYKQDNEAVKAIIQEHPEYVYEYDRVEGEKGVIIALRQHNYPLFYYFLEHGVDVETYDDYSHYTLLMVAIQCKHYEAARTLITKYHANVNAYEDGDTPLTLAVRDNAYGFVWFLLTHGADINKVGSYQMTPLMLAIRYGYDELAVLLLDYDADVNKSDINGVTTLMYLMERDIPDKYGLLSIILNKGADIDAEDMDGNTAVSITEKKDDIMSLEMFDIYRKTGMCIDLSEAL